MHLRTCAVVLAGALLPLAVCGSELSQRRAAERQARAAALKALPDAVKRANTPYANALAAVGQWLVGLQAKNDAQAVVTEIEALDDKNAALVGLKKSVEGIATPAFLDEAKQKELVTRLKAARKTKASALVDMASTYYRSGLPKQAYELVQQALEVDPDNNVARQALGQVKVNLPKPATPQEGADKGGAEWKDPFTAQHMQKGNVYVPELGWVPAQVAERVKNGEWFENGKWMPLDDADKLHSTAATPWVIETQHFTLRSTAGRKQSVQMAERLEGMWQVCYAEYLDFFVRERRGQQMSFTHAVSKKMLVHLFGEKADYDAMVKKELKAAPAIVAALLLLPLPGFYTPLTHASCFNQTVPEPFRTVFSQNQIASQILSEYAQTGAQGPRPWISASVCDGVQQATPDEKGRYTVPPGRKHPAVAKAAEMSQAGNIPQLAKLFTLDDTAFHNPLMPGNGETAAALGRFLLETKEGAYAADYLEFVYDSYRGAKNASLNEYIGMDNATLEKEFWEYLK